LSDELALRLLDKLERLEAERLAWGLVDGGFTAEELELHATELVEGAFAAEGSSIPPAAGELISILERRVLIWASPEAPRRYRTRIGEAVRLLVRLRQMFREEDWSVGPTLTSDFRYHIAPRRFPKRELDPDSLLNALAQAVLLSDGQDAVLRSLLRADSTGPVVLSQFQAEAAEAVLAGVDSSQISASVIAAGTGSGKTLAFLLPTLVHLAGLSGKRSYASAIAVYPRNELLKDQIRATLERLLPVSDTLSRVRGQRTSIGVLYGSVPWTASGVLERREWRQVNGPRGPARTCPFVRCVECGRDMAWHESDINEDRHVLYCPAQSCGASLPEGTVCLTRDRLVSSPPDILFTSAEMLNRSLSHPQVSRVFGVGTNGAPALLILDEIHTYSGPHGAQVALLLRRWRKLSAARPHVIGLSATIADATRFMSELTGVFENNIRLIEPALESISVQGAEYLIAVRGDPVSETSLLSTTIQAAMLLRRVLDPPGSGGSGGAFGSKLFVFGDNLDVINRLYDNLSDAEGYWSNGRANRRAVGSLANLRNPAIAPSHQRWLAGQSWDLSADIGHALHPGIRALVGRVSSQDTGVDSSASTLVATASLEVGFDDPEVGAVLQHKAPRDPAQYVQRRGRAGRTMVMRPITLVVLSDYGRDRLAYQRYEDLFSPVVAAKYLPVENPYVLKIQAGYSLLDWLSGFLPASARTSVFDLLSRAQQNSHIASVIADQLEGLLTDGQLQAKFASFLEKVLEITPRQVQDILWAPPRSLLFEAVPTALRRLRTGWAGEPVPSRSATPLPEFLPAALFADLNLPEVVLSLPERSQYQSRSAEPTEPKVERMPFRQALSEFAPGRVSRRFGTSHALLAHWIPVPAEDPDETTIDVSSFLVPGSAADLGEVAFLDQSGETSIRVLRPFALKLEQPPSDIEPTSNASLVWRTSFFAPEAPRTISFPPSAASQHLIADVAAYLHGDGAPVEVHRFALGTRADTRFKGRPSRQREAYYSFTRNDERVGLGFSQTVDGIRFRLSLPLGLSSSVLASQPLQRHVRVLRFQECVHSDVRLDGVANRFQRDWLCDAVLATLGRSFLTRRVTPGEVGADEGLFSASVLVEALSTIFDATLEEDADEPQGNRRFEDLRAILSRPSAIAVLRDAAGALWDPIDSTWESWLSRVAHQTMGAALLSACQHLVSELSFDDLLVDVVPMRDGESGSHEIWLSEDTPGGSGIVERLVVLIAEDPQRFLGLVESALEPSDSEQSRANLGKVAAWLSRESPHFDESIAESAARVRDSGSHIEEVSALEELKCALREAGLLLTPTTLAAVNLRLLRPGSSEQTDRLYHRMASEWEESERVLGFEVSPRVLAEIWSHDSSMDQILTSISVAGEGNDPTSVWRYRILNSLLWPTAGTLRREGLQYYNPYAAPPICDRLILMSLIAPSIPLVDVSQARWLERLGEAVRGHGAADLMSSGAGLPDLRKALLSLAVRPLDAGILLVHPRVGAHARRDGLDYVRVEVPELFGVAFDE
jgi:ATP-dependent helicase Lhr and Lhr-like helicase